MLILSKKFTRLKFTSLGWLSDGLILTAANFVAALGNYLFQALMKRHLPWSEFGYLNATLSLILFAGVPLTAASQALTHHLAKIRVTGDEDKINRFQAASLKLLRHLTWILFAACLLLIYPLSEFLHFPRQSLIWVGLLWVPVNLWNALGGAWCGGLSRFRLLSALLILTAIVRLTVGAAAVSFYPWAEAGIFANILSGLVIAAVAVFSPHHGTDTELQSTWLNRDLFDYGAAALAVAFSSFVFLQGDQMVAQRHFPADELGRFIGAGLLGRTIVWASLPVLTVYFTRRSGQEQTLSSSTRLLVIYLLMIGAGAISIILLRHLLLTLFLGAQDPGLAAMTARFALTMVPIGILQAMGYHYLAARRISECLVFGACGLFYLMALAAFGRTPALMLNWMSGAACASIVLLGFLSLILRIRKQPRES